MICRNLAVAAAVAGLVAGAMAPARADEPTVLKFAYPGPLASWPATKGVAPWAAKIKAASGDLVEIKIYPGIASYRNVYDRILNGVADFGFGTFGRIEGQFPKTSVTGLPFLADNSVETGLGVWRLYAKGVIADEYRRVKPIAMFGFGNSELFLTSAIKSLDDLKGLKVFANGRSVARIVTLVGAVPITSNPAELFQGLNRGIAHGAVFTWSGVQQFKLVELIKFDINIPFGRTGGYFFMNKEAFARLPAKAQQAIDKYSGDDLSRFMGQEADNQDEADRAHVMAANPNQKGMKLSAAELDKLRHVLAPVTDEWVKATPDGAKVLAAYRAEVEEMRKH